MTASGIEQATFRFVAQHINHCATAVHPVSNRPEQNNAASGPNSAWWKWQQEPQLDVWHSCYPSVNRTIRLWTRLPAEILGALPCKPNAFRKRVRKVINVVNRSKCVLKTIQKCSEVKWSAVKRGKSRRTVKGIYGWWSEVKVMLKLLCNK